MTISTGRVRQGALFVGEVKEAAVADMNVLPWNKTTLAFLLAGRCWVSLEDVLTGTRFTYEVRQKVDMGDVTVTNKKGKQETRRTIVKRYDFWFVSLQKGAIGEAKPRYLGIVDPKGFRTTTKTRANVLATAENINMFGDVLRDLRAGLDRGHQVKIWHCGRCGRCGRALSVPSSIATGLGPDCAADMGITMVDVKPNLIEKIAAHAEPTKQED